MDRCAGPGPTEYLHLPTNVPKDAGADVVDMRLQRVPMQGLYLGPKSIVWRPNPKP